MKTEKCTICKRGINLSVEHFLILDEFKGNKELCKTYYHKNCFADKMLVQRKMNGMLNNMGGLINGVKEKFGIQEKREEYIIKN